MNGIVRCATFASERLANDWAAKIEAEIEQIKATGVISAKGQTLGKLVDRYVEELEPVKRWGHSKSLALARLKRDLGHIKASQLTSAHVTHYFTKRRNGGTGGVSIAGEIGYLAVLLRTARDL